MQAITIGLALLTCCLAGEAEDAAFVDAVIYKPRQTIIEARSRAGDVRKMIPKVQMIDLCVSLKDADLFDCDSYWSAGAGGSTLSAWSDDKLTAHVNSTYPDVTMSAYPDAEVAWSSVHEQKSTPESPDMPSNNATSSISKSTVYLLDQAVVAEHVEFVRPGNRSSILSLYAKNWGETRPCSTRHGTHVASLIVGNTFGFAKHADVVPVDVIGSCTGSGYASEVIVGLDWILTNHEDVEGEKLVAMTMNVPEGPAADLVEEFVSELLQAGIKVVASAGGKSLSADDGTSASVRRLSAQELSACNAVPSRMKGVTTVARFGTANEPCIDLVARGSQVIAASSESPVATTVYTGNSQAMAIAAGLILSGAPPIYRGVVKLANPTPPAYSPPAYSPPAYSPSLPVYSPPCVPPM